MQIPRLIAFDLDDTLAPSKSPLPPPIAEQIACLLQYRPVCVISGGKYAQFESQVLAGLGLLDEARLEALHLMPTCGTQYVRREAGKWTCIYSEDLPREERSFIAVLIEQEARRLGLWEAEPWGPIIEDRESQVTFSALGQFAPVDQKTRWDPEGARKSLLRDAISLRLPHLEVRSGGSTSIDVTRRGIDKAYGLRKLAEATGIPTEEMLFIGDRLDVDGNDYPVIATGVKTRAVAGWEETTHVISDIVSVMLTSQEPGAVSSSVTR